MHCRDERSISLDMWINRPWDVNKNQFKKKWFCVAMKLVHLQSHFGWSSTPAEGQHFFVPLRGTFTKILHTSTFSGGLKYWKIDLKKCLVPFVYNIIQHLPWRYNKDNTVLFCSLRLLIFLSWTSKCIEREFSPFSREYFFFIYAFSWSAVDFTSI